jgi:hypothetical protein
VSKLSSFGPFPASYQVGFGVFPVHPDVGPSWKIRAAIVILLPRARRSNGETHAARPEKHGSGDARDGQVAAGF